MNSWKTTALGIAMIVGAIATAAMAVLDGDPATMINLTATGTAIAGGWGLIVARDNSKTSEDIKAKR